MANKKASADTVRTGIGEITIQGDLLYKGASDLERLAKGTAAQVLTMNGGATAPSWATPSGGATTLIARNTFTNASTIEITSGFDSSTYDSYLLMVNCSSISSSGSMMGIRTSSNGGSSFDSSSGHYKYAGNYTSTSNTHAGTASNSSHNIPFDVSNLTATGFQLELVILRPDITSTYTTLMVRSSHIDASGYLISYNNIGQRLSNGLVNGVQLFQWGSMLITGTYQFIGYKKA